MDEIAITFGQLERMLARANGIDEDKRTAFQSRLKNFHRLGYPPNLEMMKGKATLYRPRDIIRISLAVQLTQLGIGPDRVAFLLTREKESSVATAIGAGALAILRKPKGYRKFVDGGLSKSRLLPDSHYLCLDPFGLQGLVGEESLKGYADMVGHLSEDQLKSDLQLITFSPAPRLALVNVTAVIELLAPPDDEGTYKQSDFLHDLVEWAERVVSAEVGKVDGDT